jgi:hypothetical protein
LVTKPSRLGPNPDSLRRLVRAVEKSKRTRAVQLPLGFLQRAAYQAADPPLARMLRGGRSGEVRLKTYLSLTLVATSKPYDIKESPARWWAEMLALPDPEGLGARRVSDALNWLAKEQFIQLTRRVGKPPDVVLLDPTGSGAQYERPRKRWVAVPLGLWKQQWITALSGKATALLLVLLDLQGGAKSPAEAPSLATGQRSRYGLSEDTWTRATAELVAHELLTVHRVPQGRDHDWRRLRNTFWLDKDAVERLSPTMVWTDRRQRSDT